LQGQPQALCFIIDTNPSEEVVELAELIYQSSKHQFQYIENFIKLLKDQDNITNLPESRLLCISVYSAWSQRSIAAIVVNKKIKLDIEVTVDKAVYILKRNY
jgi:hypothetical protein